MGAKSITRLFHTMRNLRGCFLPIPKNDSPKYTQYQPSGAGGTRSPPATPHRLQRLTAHVIQNGRRGPEIGQTLGYGSLRSTFDK